jgi:hypothetical protein
MLPFGEPDGAWRLFWQPCRNDTTESHNDAMRDFTNRQGRAAHAPAVLQRLKIICSRDGTRTSAHFDALNKAGVEAA